MESSINHFHFGEALRLIQLDKKVSRSGWNGKGMWLALQKPDANSANTLPYIYMVIPAGSSHQFGENGNKDQRVPWLASQTDLLAWDWVEVV